MRVDRDEWKRTAGRLIAENNRLTDDLAYIAELSENRCKVVLVTIPCPTVTVGPGVGVRTQPELDIEPRVVQVTVGIPVRIFKPSVRR